MVYYKKTDFKLKGYRKSRRKNKMYDAILERKDNGKLVHVPFGDVRYQNYKDDTGLNAYPKLIHGDKNRRERYKKRHIGYVKNGYYSPSFFSFNILW